MVELFPESPAWSKSPRMSFSHDFPQTPPPSDAVAIDRHPLLDSPSDFQFFSADSYSCSADDLFSHGRILPVAPSRLRPHPPPSDSSTSAVDGTASPTQPPPPSRPAFSDRDDVKHDDTMREIMKPIPEETNTAPTKESKNFWGFRRSSSLNSDGGSKLSLLCNLPLLLRSNSTGSVNQTQKKDPSKSTHKSSKRFTQPSPVSTASTSKPLPPLKKNDKPRPVLNVPPPYISPGTANLFGFGYFFRHGKDNSGKGRSNLRRSTTTC